MLKNTLILLLLTSLFTTKIAFEHRKCRKINRDQIIKDCNDSASEETLLDNHIPERICSVIPHPKLIINPYKNLTKNEFLKPKNITALCLRCGTCLAIADKFKSVVHDTINEEPSHDPLELAEILKQEVKTLCEDSFKNYDLRRYEDDIIVTNTFPATTHVTSDLDFKWPTVLKSTCHQYVEKIDFLKWIESYLDGELDITDELCRGEGFFRECKNVNYHYVVLDDGYDYLAMCTCSCASKDQHTY